MIDYQWAPVRAVRLQDLDPFTSMRLVDQVRDTYYLWRTLRRGYEDVWRQIDRQVNQYDPIYSQEQRLDNLGFQFKTGGGFGSKVKLANAYTHREGLVAGMLKYLMENGYDFFDPIPLDPLDDDKVQAIKQYLMWLFDTMGFEQAFTPFCRDVVQYGIGIASYEWKREVVPRWKRGEILDPNTGRPMIIDYEAQDVIYDAPKFTPINIYHTVIDPAADDVKTATLIYKRALTPYEILANKNFSNVNWAQVSNAPDFGGNFEAPLETDRELARGNSTYASISQYKGKKEVYEAWGDFTDGPVIYKNYVCAVLDRRLIRFEPNPYMLAHKPFVVARCTTETARVYGPSMLAPITGLQAAMDTVVNQYIDWWTMEINRPILVQANTIVKTAKDDKTKLPPISKDAVWTVRSTDGVKRMDWGSRSSTMDPTALITAFASQMEAATGDSPLMSGGTPQKYMKTGVAVTVADAGNAKFNMYAKNIEGEAIVTVLSMTLDFLRQMDVPIKTFKRQDVPNAQEVTFNPADLSSEIRFTMRGASYNASKQLQVNNLQQFLLAIAGNQFLMPIINWVRAIIIMGEALGIRNARELLSPQAAMQLNQTPNMQPTFFDRVKGLLGITQQPQNAGMMGQPQPQINQEDNINGQQFSGSLAGISGGTGGGGGQVSPFDGISQIPTGPR